MIRDLSIFYRTGVAGARDGGFEIPGTPQSLPFSHYDVLLTLDAGARNSRLADEQGIFVDTLGAISRRAAPPTTAPGRP